MSEAQLGTIEPRGRAAGEGSEVPGPAHDVGSLGVHGHSDAGGGANVGRVPVGPAPGRAMWRWRSWPSAKARRWLSAARRLLAWLASAFERRSRCYGGERDDGSVIVDGGAVPLRLIDGGRIHR